LTFAGISREKCQVFFVLPGVLTVITSLYRESCSICILIGSRRIGFIPVCSSEPLFHVTLTGRGHFKFTQDDPVGNRCLGDGVRRLDRPLYYLVLCLAQHAQRYEGIPSWSLFFNLFYLY
jgi:hypothetical protein